MKAKVIKAYTDKHTSQIHLIGEDVELKADRAKELAAEGFVELLAAPASKQPKTKKD